jgi:hypothetical protein
MQQNFDWIFLVIMYVVGRTSNFHIKGEAWFFCEVRFVQQNDGQASEYNELGVVFLPDVCII